MLMAGDGDGGCLMVKAASGAPAYRTPSGNIIDLYLNRYLNYKTGGVVGLILDGWTSILVVRTPSTGSPPFAAVHVRGRRSR